MEEFKSLEELTQIDHKHNLLAIISSSVPDLETLHQNLSKEVLNDKVPDEIKGQFNVAKNMALYTYFFYALPPEVHLKTYTIIEHALRLKTQSKKEMMLKALLNHAVAQRWIKDSGVRHFNTNEPGNEWCKSMVDIIPKMRNSKAHGSTMLMPDCLHHISVCTDLCNQLFPSN